MYIKYLKCLKLLIFKLFNLPKQNTQNTLHHQHRMWLGHTHIKIPKQRQTSHLPKSSAFSNSSGCVMATRTGTFHARKSRKDHRRHTETRMLTVDHVSKFKNGSSTTYGKQGAKDDVYRRKCLAVGWRGTNAHFPTPFNLDATCAASSRKHPHRLAMLPKLGKTCGVGSLFIDYFTKMITNKTIISNEL